MGNRTCVRARELKEQSQAPRRIRYPDARGHQLTKRVGVADQKHTAGEISAQRMHRRPVRTEGWSRSAAGRLNHVVIRIDDVGVTLSGGHQHRVRARPVSGSRPLPGASCMERLQTAAPGTDDEADTRGVGIAHSAPRPPPLRAAVGCPATTTVASPPRPPLLRESSGGCVPAPGVSSVDDVASTRSLPMEDVERMTRNERSAHRGQSARLISLDPRRCGDSCVTWPETSGRPRDNVP